MQVGGRIEMVTKRNLSEIANWFAQLRSNKPQEEQVLLPPLQRGWVWRPEQVEGLWDSIMRGFPISSFVWMPTETSPPRYILLDGQQRAKAIALGFWSPWSNGCKNAPDNGESQIKGKPLEIPRESVLWIDLKEPPTNSRRKYLFRLVTKYHPWGFSRTDSSRLETQKIRDAVEAFKKANKELQNKLPAEFGLKNVWPWDAEAPIPVGLLVEAVRNSNLALQEEAILVEVKKRLEKLPFWGEDCVKSKDGKTIQEKVEECIDAPFAKSLLGILMERLSENSGYEVPIIQRYKETGSNSDTSSHSEQTKDTTDGQDELEILFERLNRGGTRIEGEELVYSLLKSACPEVASLVEREKQRLVPPSRYVSLASRLLLAEKALPTGDRERASGQGLRHEFPSSLSVARFRSLIKKRDKENEDFRDKLERLIRENEPTIFQKAYELLTKDSFGLPSVLAVNIARSSPDLLLLLLLVLHEKPDEEFFDENRRKKLIGMMTAITFFGDQKKCAKRLWEGVIKEDFRVEEIFSGKSFKRVLEDPVESNRVEIPLIKPDIFLKAMEEKLIKEAEKGDAEIWKKPWEWVNDVPDAVKKHFENPFDGRGVDRSAWGQFVWKLKEEKRLLLYVQRQFLKGWCREYDPTIPESIEDRNRPWDYDHIFPYKYFGGKHGVDQLIRPYLVYSIGNLRAWPMELNRSEGATLPREKLRRDQGDEQLMKIYGLSNTEDVRNASFVCDQDLKYWEKLDSDSAKDKEKRVDLVRAIVLRLCRIYEDWYTTLGIGEMINNN